MFSVMRSCTNVERQLLLLIQIAVHSIAQHAMNRARDICSMNAIVVRVVSVAGLQRHQERNKPVLWYLEVLHQASAAQAPEREHSHRVPIRHFVHFKCIPLGQILADRQQAVGRGVFQNGQDGVEVGCRLHN